MRHSSSAQKPAGLLELNRFEVTFSASTEPNLNNIFIPESNPLVNYALHITTEHFSYLSLQGGRLLSASFLMNTFAPHVVTS